MIRCSCPCQTAYGLLGEAGQLTDSRMLDDSLNNLHAVSPLIAPRGRRTRTT